MEDSKIVDLYWERNEAALSDLREAELTLEETGPQREKLIAEINQLKLDIEALKSQGAAGD